ncbi:MAG: sulfide/dihydroorotate dehydrogenase-like FAD/NAD-binding protein [Bacteroidales bacterium]
MFEIIKKEYLSSAVFLMEVKAERIAKTAQPGQFLIVIANEDAERIPLTISDSNLEKGTVTIVTQMMGASTLRLSELKRGEFIHDVVGPLGEPSNFVTLSDEEISKKSYLFIAGGLGAAPIYPQVKYLKERGAKIDIILGSKSEKLLVYEDELTSQCDNMFICTDDGSKGFKGVVTKRLELLMEDKRHYDQVISVGPMIMMKFVAYSCERFDLPLVVSLNTIMVDGTGMCGACRVTVDGKTKFACVDGPEFDGRKVDFDEAMRRQKMYNKQEADALKEINR